MRAQHLAVRGDLVMVLDEVVRSADLLYLDCYDIDVNNPESSVDGHIKELLGAQKMVSMRDDLLVGIGGDTAHMGRGKYET